MHSQNIFLKTLLDLSWFIGIIVLFGLLLGFLRTNSMKNYQNKLGNNAIYITGIVGVPVHELSHFAMAKIFGHRVTEMKLFQVKSGDNSLGYVKHSYNTMNVYQQIGNFFIGVAPIICGSLCIILLIKLFTPSSFDLLSNTLSLNGSFEFIKSIFSFSNFKRPEFYLFLYLVFSICSHISLSRADIKGAFIGVIFIFGILLIFNYVNFDIKSNIDFIKYNILITNILIISTIFSVINLGFSYLVKAINI